MLSNVFLIFPSRILNKLLLLCIGIWQVLSRFNELKQKYSDLCGMYTDESKVKTKVTFEYAVDYSTRSCRLRGGCSIIIVETEAIQKALQFAKPSWKKQNVNLTNSVSLSLAVEDRECKNPLANIVLQRCQEIFTKEKYIIFIGSLTTKTECRSW